jgi:hypothetical protein
MRTKPVRFGKGERVSFFDSGEKVFGRVTSVKGWRRTIVTDSNNRVEKSARALRPARDEVLVLESRLDYDLKSKRHSGTFLREFLEAYGINVLYEKVHSKRDLEGFLQLARRKTQTYGSYTTLGTAAWRPNPSSA